MAVLDSSGDQAHIASISGRILTKRCFSEADDRSIEYGNIGSDPEVSYYWRYRSASACPNGENSASYIGDRDVVEYHRVNGTDKIRTLSSNHLSHVIHSAQQYSNQKFLALSVSRYGSVGDIFVSPASLKNAVSRQGIIDGLNFVLANHLQYKIRVVNLSLGTSFHEGNGNCDSATLTNQENVIRNKIIELSNKGIVVVAAAGNSLPSGVDSGMMFQACLSYVVSVGGVTTYENKYYFAGTTSASIDFLDEYYYDSSYNDNSISGTSIASPKVAGVISEMMAINPGLSRAEILQKLLDTANRVGPVYYPNDPGKSDTQRLIPNPLAAIDAVKDPFWKEIIELIKDVINSVKIGWNYGSDEHSNGALIVFPQMTLPLAKLVDNQPVARFSLNAYDIDTVDEVEVLINDKPYGFLDVTGSNVTGGTQVFCIPQSDLVSVGSNEVKLRLKNSQETWGVTNFKVEVGQADSQCYKNPTPPLEENEDRIAGQSGSIGNAYGETKVSSAPFQFDFRSSNSELPTPSNYDTADVRRDLRIRFIVKGGVTSSEDNGTIVSVNNRQVLVTPFIYGDEQEYQIIVNRSYFRNGSNQVEFKPRENLSNSIWGIRNISIEYIEPVSLTVDAVDVGEYGDSETPSRYAGLRANFDLEAVTNDHEFSVTGWDIDTANETRVFINGNNLGYLDVSSNRAYNDGSSFVLPKAFLKVGTNQIELVQKRPVGDYFGGSAEPWATKDLKVSLLRPDLLPSDVKIIEKYLSPNESFTVSAVISNVGEGSSNGAVLNYYRSNNSTIMLTDTLIASTEISGVNAGESVTIKKSLRSLLVNQGYFIGVCIANVVNESVTGNNCSVGIRMNSTPITSPIMLLLLDE